MTFVDADGQTITVTNKGGVVRFSISNFDGDFMAADLAGYQLDVLIKGLQSIRNR